MDVAMAVEQFAQVFAGILHSLGLSATKFASQLEDRRDAQKNVAVDGISKASVLAYTKGERLPSGETFLFMFEQLRDNALATEQQLEHLRAAYQAARADAPAYGKPDTPAKRWSQTWLTGDRLVAVGCALAAVAAIGYAWRSPRGAPSRTDGGSMLGAATRAVRSPMLQLRDTIRPTSGVALASKRVVDLLARTDRPNGDFERAVRAIAEQRPEEALNIAAKAESLKSMPKESACWIRSVAAFHTGDYRRARQEMEAVFRAAPASLENIEDLAMLRFYDRDYEGARQLFARASELRTEQGMFELKTAEAASNLAMSMGALGRDSEGMLWRALAIYAVVQREPSVEQAGVVSNLASHAFGKGDYAGAERLFAFGIDMLDRLADDARDPVTVATLRNNLGMCELRMGNEAGAKQHFAEALELRERNLPANHPDTAESLMHVAHLEAPTVAEGMYRRAIAILEAKHGKDSAGAGMAYLSLSQCLDSLGRRAESVRLLEKVRALVRPLPKADALAQEFLRVEKELGQAGKS